MMEITEIRNKLLILLEEIKKKHDILFDKQTELNSELFIIENIQKSQLRIIYSDETLKNEKIRELKLDEFLNNNTDYKIHINNLNSLKKEIEKEKINLEFLQNNFSSFKYLIKLFAIEKNINL